MVSHFINDDKTIMQFLFKCTRVHCNITSADPFFFSVFEVVQPSKNKALVQHVALNFSYYSVFQYLRYKLTIHLTAAESNYCSIFSQTLIRNVERKHFFFLHLRTFFQCNYKKKTFDSQSDAALWLKSV